MPVNDDVSVSEGKGDFPPIPTDVYQVQVNDVEVVTGKKYKSNEEQKQLRFRFVILDEGDQKGRFLQTWASITWFPGQGQRSPSKLFTIIKAIHDFYYKDKKTGTSPVADWTADMITSAVLNDLIGKQVRVSSSEITGGGKVTGFMPIKQTLPEWKNEEPPHPAEADSDTITV